MAFWSKKQIKNDDWKVCGISKKYPTYRNNLVVTIHGWLQGKRSDDQAEGLWRIHDTLYDFTEFVRLHPGGSFWLQQTKGTDITEPFETHHLSTVPEQMLSKYAVRKAAEPRNYTFTMHEKGFYKILKSRVREKLQQVDYRPSKRTDLMHLSLLVATLSFVLASVLTGSIVFEILAALALCWLAIASHNYFHRRDNWQMYAFNLTLMNFSMWRISHALSHHVYTNSLHDLEMSMFEPFLCWIPNAQIATKFQRVIMIVIQPVIYTAIYLVQFITRLVQSIVVRNVMFWHDAIGFTLPLLMLVVSNGPFITVIRQWLFIIATSSFIFGLIGLNAAHHDPKIHHDGDANRTDKDWGLFQIDTVIDRLDIKKSAFLVLTHFGEHALHHLFPTLDHGILPQLQPILISTLKEFHVPLRECSQFDHIIGQNKQLLRTKPNAIPPDVRTQ